MIDRLIKCSVLAASIAALQIVYSFHIPWAGVTKSPCHSRLCLIKNDLGTSRSKVGEIAKIWSSRQENDPEKSDEDAKKKENEAYDGLYEFLTRRTGEEAGESDRRRKRDRIRELLSSNKRPSSNMVRPIRMEDGGIMEVEQPETTLSSDSSSGADTVDAVQNPLQKAQDDSWFDNERNQIRQEYQQIQQNMKEQIQKQRIEDPESVPSNAEGIVDSIVSQEMERMLTSVKVARAKERLQELEISKMVELQSKDLRDETDEIVERMLKEAAADWERRDALQSEVDEYYQYEKEALEGTFRDENLLQPGANLDTWALERLEEMLESSQTRSNDVSDILEMQIDDLRDRIEKESKKGPIEPQTMKEWQMYRAIATRLGKENVVEDGNAIRDQDSLNDEEIAKQLNLWREYEAKEEDFRKRSGLAVGPRMPFEWQRAKRDPQLDELPPPPKNSGKKSPQEARREVNLQAIQAMEELVKKSDNLRAEGLKKQLEILKAELESCDYNDKEDESVEEVAVGPVDLRDVFGPRDEGDERSSFSSNVYENDKDSIDSLFSGDLDAAYGALGPPGLESKSQVNPSGGAFSDNLNTESIPPPPNTPFFSDDFEREEKPSPPNTPFFSESNDGDDDIAIDVENSKLGSGEEQKLRAMFRRAGARTKEEKDAIREKWEAFQSLEKLKRDQSGLSDGDDSSLLEKADLKYDISEVMKGDGDFDADRILASIGPRPSRNKQSSSSLSETSQKEATERTTGSDSDGTPVPTSNLDQAEVADSLYRSVSAVGGGRSKDDPTLREQEKAAFEDFMKKEDDLRQNLDSLDKDAAEVAASSDIPIDDPGYAQDVIASIGPRPVFKRRRKQDEKEYSDRGGALFSDDDELNDEQSTDNEPSSQGDLIPDWVKKERETINQGSDTYSDGSSGLLGKDIDEVFDDDKYDHNIRQLHEYEQRRAGKKKQMGIDISDVLGRNAVGSDDYADYTYDRDYFRGQEGGWGAVTFEARKASLLDYIELSTAELNNLMDHKDSIHSTGVSKYLPRINKPFREFGAIFRLEGVLVDLTGINQQVWMKVASEFDFKQPLPEDVRRAVVTRPDIAVREIFYWTQDMFLVNKVVSVYRRTFRELFDTWAKEEGIIKDLSSTPKKTERGSMALGAEIVENINSEHAKEMTAPMNEVTRMKQLKESWSLTANEFEFPEPTNEQLAQSSFLDPEIAIRDVFRWSTERSDIDLIVSVFKYILAEASGDSLPAPSTTIDPAARDMDESTILELQYLAWKRIAEQYSFESPTPDEVYAAAVLNDPEVVITSGFEWTDDRSLVSEMAQLYRDYLTENVNSRVLDRSYVAPIVSTDVESTNADEGAITSVGPTDEQILKTQVEAWSITAKAHKIQAPPTDQVQLAMNLNAKDAVRRLLGWTYNFNGDQINAISSSYEKALKMTSQKYLKEFNIQVETVGISNADSNGAKDVSADEMYKAAKDAWTTVAWESGFSLPDQDQIQFAMSVGPEEAIITGFQWTSDTKNATVIANQYLEQIKSKRSEWQKKGYKTTDNVLSKKESESSTPRISVRSGVSSWIKSLIDVEMGCGVASYLEEDHLNILLDYAGLSELLPLDRRVSLNDGYNRDSQQMLGVALRVERRPDHCVVFGSSPYSSTAAHEVDMRSVSIVGAYPSYELLSADTSSASLDELTAMNIRRLFGERVYDQPMLDMRQNQPEIKRKVKTRFWDAD